MGLFHPGKSVKIHDAVLLTGGREVEVMGTGYQKRQRILEHAAGGRQKDGSGSRSSQPCSCKGRPSR
jgi:hypothetical protein